MYSRRSRMSVQWFQRILLCRTPRSTRSDGTSWSELSTRADIKPEQPSSRSVQDELQMPISFLYVADRQCPVDEDQLMALHHNSHIQRVHRLACQFSVHWGVHSDGACRQQ